MIDLIVKKLKTGPIPAVVPFGSATPGGTYTVVKEEPTGLGYTRYRVITHMAVGQTAALRTHCKETVYDLLAWTPIVGTGPDTRRCVLTPLGVGQLTTTNSDGTISQEAVFSLADMSY